MSEEPKPDSSMKTWVMGIAGTVIAAVLITVITQMLSRPTPPLPDPHPPIAPINVNGRVVDKNSNQLLKKVTVLLAVGGQSMTDNTDDEGRYSFSLTGASNSGNGLLTASAAGYGDGTRNISFSQPTQDDFYLVPAGPPVALSNTGLKAAMFKYQIRPQSVALRLQSQSK